MNRLSMTLALGLCSSVALAAVAQQPPLDKGARAVPAPDQKPPKFLPLEQRESTITVLVHSAIDGSMIAGHKVPADGLKALGKLFTTARSADKISENSIFQDRLYRQYRISPADEAKLAAMKGREVTIKIKEMAPGRNTVVAIVGP